MNKVLIAAIAIVLVAVGAFALLNNQAQKKESAPTQTQAPEVVQGEETTVTLTASGFEPETIRVKVGTKVTWLNKSGDTAAINSDIHPIHTLYPFLNLGSFADGSSVEVVFDKVGTYTYHNHLNPGQTGKVVVQ